MEKSIGEIAIVGHHAKDQYLNDGQTVKTRNLANQLIKMYGEDKIQNIDTYNWKMRPFKLLFNCVKAIKKNDNIIILPAHNGVKIFVPLFAFLNKFYKKNLIYVVIGAWLADEIQKKKSLIKNLKKFNYIFVETKGLKSKLNKLGLANIQIMLNFKHINVLSLEEITFSSKDIYQLCTFSRVMKEKGISDAIAAVSLANKKYGKKIFHLNVFGPVDSNYEKEFQGLLKKCYDCVTYRGVIDSEKSVETLKKYDLLLFPTRFKTEGLPGTIIDAFSAGLPVVYSDWDNCDEFFTDKYNGIKFRMTDIENLSSILINFYEKKYNIKKMCENCLNSAKKYDSDNAIKALVKYLR